MTDRASPSATVAALHRYPVKGLSPEALDEVQLSRHATLPHDRQYAIENGPSGFDPAAPAHMPKIRFLMLMRQERLAELQTHFDPDTRTLTVRHGDATVAQGNLGTETGRRAIEAFFAKFSAADLKGPPRVLEAPGHSFSDVAKKVVSIINLDSVRALGEAAGAPVDPLRFRGNLQVAGWPAWFEFGLLGNVIRIGDARLKIVKRIVRCAATEVDPATAARDLPVPKILMSSFGHMDCGVYAEVIEGGLVRTGQPIELIESEPRLPL